MEKVALVVFVLVIGEALLVFEMFVLVLVVVFGRLVMLLGELVVEGILVRPC